MKNLNMLLNKGATTPIETAIVFAANRGAPVQQMDDAAKEYSDLRARLARVETEALEIANVLRELVQLQMESMDRQKELFTNFVNEHDNRNGKQ